MRRNAILTAACLAAILTTANAMAQTPPSTPRPQVQQDGLTWEVRYLVDTSQDPGGISQFDSPRSNRGVGVSPDGRYLYLGYNEPNGSPVAGRHDHQVRIIDTQIEDFTDSIVTILNRHRGKSIAVDDVGRVYLAEGSDSDVHLGAGGIHIFDASLGVELAVIPIGSTYGLAKPEGVTVRREAGVLALYATDRSTKKLYRFVISEGPGFAITAITKAGLSSGIGEVLIPGATDLRGVKIETGGRIWMADLGGNKVYRCEADGSGCLVTPVSKPMDVGLLGQRAFVTQYTSPVSPTITVLRQSDMSFDSLLVAPWSGLRLDPVGQKQPVPNGPFLGNFAGTGLVRLPNGDRILYFSNERGQTEFEKSVYGRCDEFSDNPGGPCVFTDLTVDDNEPVFRIYEPNRTIGDFVWIDTDGDGIQDAGELGIEGVTVTLSGPGGLQTTTTDADGMYLFSDLLEGTYTVTVAAPVGYTASPANAPGSTPANDSEGSEAIVTLGAASSSNLTIDFGFVPPASGAIGDFVWSDLNGNGIQDLGEPGLENILVTLDGPGGEQMAFTDATGFYQFTGLLAGTYTVTVATPPGTTPSPSSAPGSTPADDSNGSPATVALETNSSSDQTIDFGFVPPALGAIGDFVWSDLNADGIQDPGEPGFAGVVVTLNGPGGPLTTTTDATGFYQFTGLSAGSYTVIVATPPGTSPSPSNSIGSNSANDSNGSPASVTLATNSSTDLSIDFGFVMLPTGALGDFVWSDLNGNGIQDVGEPGIAGVQVTLTGPGAPQVTITDATGYYQFTGLPAGTYSVSATTPPGTTPSPASAPGSMTANDSNGPAAVTLASNGNDQTIDFGFVPPPTGALGDFVWSDVNGNGIQDVGEPGIGGVTVTLSGPGGPQTTTTNASGFYQFTGLGAGTYTVTVATPASYTPSPSNAGANTAIDSNGSPATVTLPTNSSTNSTIDFGFIAPAVCVPTTFHFTGSTSTHGTAGNLRSFSAGGVSVKASAFSRVDGTGSWSTAFLGLYGPGLGVTDGSEGDGSGNRHKVDNVGGRNNYVLFEFSSPVVVNQAFLDYIGVDSDLSVWIGTASDPYNNHLTLSDALLAGLNREDNDTTSTADSRWADLNATGRSGNVLIIASSASDTTPDDEFKLSKLTIECPPTGNPPTGSIGNFVWSDTNANGLQDSGEPGLSGVTVQLKNSSGTVIQTTTTNASGVYQFTGLGAGTYTVVMTTPPSYTASPSNAGTNPAIDSNGSPATVTLATNSSTDQTIDFGLVAATVCVPVTFTFSGSTSTSGSAGNLRTFTSGGVSVKASAFSRVDSTGSWSTAYLGLYGPGLGVTDGSEGDGSGNRHKVDNVGGRNNYVLFEFSSPVVVNQAFLDYIGVDSDLSVWVGTTADPYNNHLTLSDALLATLVREDNDTTSTADSRWADFNGIERAGNVLIIASSASDTTPDDEFKISKLALSCVPGPGPGGEPTGTIGNFVWNDLNANGIQDSGEPGLANVTVRLKNSAGTVIQTDTTDSSGFYLFTGLPAGSYSVVVTMPSGYVATTSVAPGSTTANDSNGSPAAVTLATNSSSNLTIDFGFVKVASGYSTYTQGGWGSRPQGNNPGALLRDNFYDVYPVGYVRIGGTKTLKFTTAKAIEVFLPQGSTANVLLASATNPTGSAAGVFAGQVLALRLSVDFSNSGITKAGLGDLIVVSGSLAGYTVNQVLALANTVLGGTKSALPAGVTISKLNEVVDAINNNFDNGTTNNGYLR